MEDTIMAVNGNERRGPNLAAIAPTPRERVGTLAAITEREEKAAMYRKMGHASARLMADGRPYTWGEIGTGRGPRKSQAQRAADEARATKLAKKKAR